MKKLIALLFVLICVLSLVGCSQAEQGDTTATTTNNAEVIAPSEMGKVVENDEDALVNLVTDFITLKEQDFQSETHLSMEQYFVPELRDSLEKQIFWKVFRFEKLIRMQQSLLWETFDFEIQDLQIQGSTATIVAFESYEYQLEKSNGISSGRGTTLYFTCEKVEDEWLIQSIDTDNELIEGHVSGYSAEELPALAGYSE